MIIVFYVLSLLWLTSYCVIHAYCVLCAVLWVGGVDAYIVGSPLLVCACYVGTHVCVSFMLDACMTTDSYIRAVIFRCFACIIMFSTIYLYNVSIA